MMDFENLSDYNKNLQPRDTEGSHLLYLKINNLKDEMIMLTVLHILSLQKPLLVLKGGSDMRNL